MNDFDLYYFRVSGNLRPGEASRREFVMFYPGDI
jgi:hypothetical protein